MTEGRRRGNPNWRPGASGNPAGRPKGARNKALLALEQAVEGQDAAEAWRRTIALAEAGNVPALMRCMRALLPPARFIPDFTLPPIASAADAAAAYDALLQAVSRGDVTPREGVRIGRRIEAAAARVAHGST